MVITHPLRLDPAAAEGMVNAAKDPAPHCCSAPQHPAQIKCLSSQFRVQRARGFRLPTLLMFHKQQEIQTSSSALPKNLKWGKNSRNDIPSMWKDLHGSEGDLDGPGKAQDHVLNNGTIVVCLEHKIQLGQVSKKAFRKKQACVLQLLNQLCCLHTDCLHNTRYTVTHPLHSWGRDPASHLLKALHSCAKVCF